MQKTVGADVFKHEMTEKYFDTVYRLALSRTKDTEHAADVTQEVFLRYIKTDKVFTSEEHVKAWLIRVTINCSNSLFTSSWYKNTAPLTEDIKFETKEKSEVYYAVAALPLKYRTAIHLFYYEDMSISDIAKATNQKETTVKSQLKRGRDMLKKALKGGNGYEF